MIGKAPVFVKTSYTKYYSDEEVRNHYHQYYLMLFVKWLKPYEHATLLGTKILYVDLEAYQDLIKEAGGDK